VRGAGDTSAVGAGFAHAASNHGSAHEPRRSMGSR
jgi:hypothetical protein